MLTKIQLFVVFCILAWFSFLQGLLIRSSLRFLLVYTLFCFYYHDRVFTPLKNMQIVQHELKKDKQTDWELEYLCDSHIRKCRSQAEAYSGT